MQYRMKNMAVNTPCTVGKTHATKLILGPYAARLTNGTESKSGTDLHTQYIAIPTTT